MLYCALSFSADERVSSVDYKNDTGNICCLIGAKKAKFIQIRAKSTTVNNQVKYYSNALLEDSFIV